MVQEVQTWVWITNETTLETIEAIGTSSFKIIEWRQTKGQHYVSYFQGTTGAAWSYTNQWSRDSWMIKGSISLTDMTWQKEYMMRDGWVVVPTAWTYHITLTGNNAWPTFQVTMHLKRWLNSSSPDIRSKQDTYNQNDSADFTVDLGKFDTITFRTEFYYTGGATSANLPAWLTKLTIQQL